MTTRGGLSTRRGRTIWGIVLLGIAVVETWGVTNPDANDTLSEMTRWIFATDTELGRWAFGIGWSAFAGWFLVHILGGRNKPDAGGAPPLDEAHDVFDDGNGDEDYRA